MRTLRIYVASVCVAGTVVLLLATRDLVLHPPPAAWFVLAALAFGSGAAALKLSSAPATFSISDTFTFASLWFFGPAAGVMAAALEALAISARLGQRPVRILFNVGAVAMAMGVAGWVLRVIADRQDLLVKPVGPRIILALVASAGIYFIVNTSLVAIPVALEQSQAFLRVWREFFRSVWLSFVGGAYFAALLVVYAPALDLTFLLMLVPLPVVLHYAYTVSLGRIQDRVQHFAALNQQHQATIEALAHAIDTKDQVTHGHIRRVQRHALALAGALGVTDERELKAIEAAALLHDTGKLAVPEHILNKPGRLTETEFEQMKLHASLGAEILSRVDFPYPVVPMVRHHHENWDGTGYPDGLRDVQIPLGARILSVIDCFDALTSDRPYRRRLATDRALAIVSERRGTMYDPAVVDKFLEIQPTLIQVEPAAASGDADAVVADRESNRPQTPLEAVDHTSTEVLALAALARAVAVEDTTATVVGTVMRVFAQRLANTLWVLYIYQPSLDAVVARFAAGPGADAVLDTSISLGSGVTGWVAANREVMVNSDAHLDLGERADRMEPALLNCLSTPVGTKTELFGVLSVYSGSVEGFDQAGRSIVQSAATGLTALLEQAGRARPSEGLAV